MQCNICQRRAVWNDGETAFCRRHAPILVELPRQRKPKRRPVMPTPRELEVLCLRAQGLSMADSAEYMNISMQTIKNHSYALKQKLVAGNLTHALVIALECGFITMSDIREGDPL